MGLSLESSGFESPADFKTRLGIPFKDNLLLSRALTHRSYLNEHPEALEDNERLEFLGDAVLDFLVGAWLYNHYPEMAEGELTRLRSALVRTDQLAEFARKINLGAAMRLGKGEAAAGGGKRPALLCGTFEALVGAIYLDLGMGEVQNFLEPILKNAADEILLARKEQDPKSIFQEWAQSQGFGPPVYRTISTSGPDHDRLFEVEVWVSEKRYGYGQGHSKQAATKAAARDALNSLDYY
ncbi:MAG: ribonuclease III [Anaerolineaceae bacterium]